MEISKQKSNQLKAISILMMLYLHLFNKPYQGLFEPLLFIGTQPLSYYISLFCDACVPIFCFLSGYGLYYKYQKEASIYNQGNCKRILKLYINYWIIVVLFVVGLGLLLSKEGYPGNFLKFLFNFTALHNSYNGAWWFFFTYILLVFTSNFTFKWVLSYSSLTIFISGILFYVLAFYSRVYIYKPNVSDVEILKWMLRQISLYGTSFFPFIVGAIALKEQWNTKLTKWFEQVKYKNWLILTGILMLVIIHALIPNFIIAPFTGIPFILLFTQLKLSTVLTKVLDYLAQHATNMWLIHMFFYMIYFKFFIYSAKYVFVIFLLLVICCTVSSIVINKINRIVLKILKIR